MLLLKLIFLVTYFLIVFALARFLDIYWNIVSIFPIKTDFWTNKAALFPWAKSIFRYSHQPNGHKETVPFETDKNKKEGCFEEPHFISYEEYLESVEDTKSSVWVVKLNPLGKSTHLISASEWKKLRFALSQFKIRTASFNCRVDPRLCLQFKVLRPNFVLSMPKGFYHKGNVSFFLFIDDLKTMKSKDVSSTTIFDWVKRKLYLRVKKVHSLSEVTSPVKARLKSKDYMEPSLFFVYKSKEHFPPMFLTALSVKFSGRVKFYLFHEDDLPSHESIALSKYGSYNYGTKKGESFSYSCIELFLQTLHPEVNDIFIVSIVLINMACWLELFLQKGGPLRRLFYYIWGFTITNMLLVFVWLPIIQIVCLPQVQPFIRFILKTLQKVMLTNLASIVRQDILQVSQHIHFLFIGFVFYGVLLGYIRLKMRDDERNNSSFTETLTEDIEEFHEFISSFIQFMTPSLQIYRFEEHIDRILRGLMHSDIWLRTNDAQEYLVNLPKWQMCCCESSYPSDTDCLSSDTEISDIDDRMCVPNQNVPTFIIPSEDCSICLESYMCKDLLIGISCGHSFHEQCLLAWLNTINSKRRCPVCRWPADIIKGDIEVVDVQE